MKCLVLVLNRCRPDYLGCYGNDWIATPAFDRLAAEAVVFDNHFAASCSEFGARLDWLSGRYAWPHLGRGDSVEVRRSSLATLCWKKGIRTVLIGDERSPTRQSPFAEGWQEQIWLRQPQLDELDQDSFLGGGIQMAIDWLQEHGQQDPWLLWLEISSLKPPWSRADYDAEPILADPNTIPEPWFDPPAGPVADDDTIVRLQNTYAGIVAGVDEWLGTLLNFLRDNGYSNDTMLVVTSDVGLALGERGQFDAAATSVYEEDIHLPLLIRFPGGEHAGRRVQQLTQSVDLMPTLVGWFGMADEERFHGRNLLAVAEGQPMRLREYACGWNRNAGGVQQSLRTHQWHLVLTERSDAPFSVELFRKPDDRWDVDNVASQRVETAEHLELALRRFVTAVAFDRLGDLPELREEAVQVVEE